MSEFRLSPEAEVELDGIWIHIARESGSTDVASRVVESITDRFRLLARYPCYWPGIPKMGRHPDDDLRPGLRSLAVDDYVIIHRIVADDVVLILHVAHGSRDLVSLLGL